MLLILAILFLIFTIAGYSISRTLVSPYVLTSGVWTIILLAYLISSPSFYYVENRFVPAILIWVTFYGLSSLFTEKLFSSRLRKHKIINEKIWKLLLVISVSVTLIACYTNIKEALTNPEFFFISLRSMNTGLDETIEKETTIWSYFLAAATILYLAELIRYPEKKKIFILLLLVNLLFSFVTMAKSMFAQLFFCTAIILAIQKRIKLKQMILPIAVLSFVMVIIQLLRTVPGSEDFSTAGFVDAYLFSGMIAFDHSNIHITGDGSHTFRLFYAIAHVFDDRISVVNPILEYATISNTGAITNVYTGLYPFYADYGMLGVFIFSIIYGSFAGFLYSHSRYSHPALILYSIFATFSLLLFFGDFFLTNLSLFLQYVFYSMILYSPKLKIK